MILGVSVIYSVFQQQHTNNWLCKISYTYIGVYTRAYTQQFASTKSNQLESLGNNARTQPHPLVVVNSVICHILFGYLALSSNHKIIKYSRCIFTQAGRCLAHNTRSLIHLEFEETTWLYHF